MKKISEFLSENFHFLVVKFSVYLNRLVFVMVLFINVTIGFLMILSTERIDCDQIS